MLAPFLTQELSHTIKDRSISTGRFVQKEGIDSMTMKVPFRPFFFVFFCLFLSFFFRANDKRPGFISCIKLLRASLQQHTLLARAAEI